MVIPSIHISQGNVLQGSPATSVGDSIEVAKRLKVAGELTLIDVDLANQSGNNKAKILEILKFSNCRVGGGIREIELAIEYLNAGATKVIIGTAASENFLSQLPKERIVVAIDCLNSGHVLTNGRKDQQEQDVFQRIQALRNFTNEFLVTFTEHSGHSNGFDLQLVQRIKEAIGKDVALTIEGGIHTSEQIASLHKLDIKSQVGTALLTGKLDLGDAISAPLVSDRPDGLFATMVVDEHGVALGLVYSNHESIRESVKTGRGVYHSRTRGLWHKGATSGATQDLLEISIDCDSDCLKFVVHQNGAGFCHFNTRSCFGPTAPGGIPGLARTLQHRKENPIPGSYTNKLLSNDDMLRAKILEEAKELVDAKTSEEVSWEAADLIYFALVAATKAGVSLTDIERHLDLRSLKVTRRPGLAKPEFEKIIAQQNEKSAEIVESKAEKQAAPEVKNQAAEIPEFSQLRRLTPDEVQILDSEAVDAKTLEIASQIVHDVQKGGEKALLHHAVRLGDIKEGEPHILRREEMKKVFDRIPEEQQEMLKRVANRIRVFAEAQKKCLTDLNTKIQGGRAGHTVSPVDCAGCYAPGGRFPLPSSVLMTAITARVAGVKTVWVCSPRPVDITIAAAYVADADALLCVGGAQAIAALAYGAGEIPACDAVVGPGNRFVTAAKSIVSGKVKIDMLAGPSECLVLADETADPAIIAADLLAQAEHDPDARAILISVKDKGLAEKVDAEIAKQLQTLPTADIARRALQNGFTVLTQDIEEAVKVSDKVAPEHLEIHVKNLEELKQKLSHYGGLFVGTYSAEVLGDYGAGPNHVLPTSATARYSGGLSVFTFLRVRTWLHLKQNVESQQVVEDSSMLAKLEGLFGHAAAADRRKNSNLKRKSEVLQSPSPPKRQNPPRASRNSNSLEDL